MITMLQKRQAIDQIAQANNGIVTPDIVVQEAKNPKHALHKCFDWNDATAAHERRLDVARHLIASIQVIVEYEDVCVSAISYVRDVRQGRRVQGYVAVDALARRKEDAKQTLLIELERIMGIVERTRGIAGSLGLSTFFEAILRAAIEAKFRVQPKPKKLVKR